MLRNIKLIYTYNFIWSLLIIMPVIVPFFESRGLSMKNIYELQAVFAFFLLILEVPSGYLSDLLGRKSVLILAAIAHGIGFSIFVFAYNFNGLVIAEIFIAVAVSLYSGSDVSIIYDTLEADGIKNAPIKIMGRRLFYMQTGEAIGGLLGGWLILYSFEAPAVVQAVAAWLPIIPALFLVEPARKKMNHKAHFENFTYVWRSLVKHSRLLNLILLTSMFYGVASLIAVWSFQKYWQELKVPLLYFGYLWAATNFAVALIGRYAHKIEKRWGSTFVVTVIGILPIVGYFGMSMKDWIGGILFCFSFQILRGLNGVVLADAINKRVRADMRATANSIVSLGVRGLFIIFGPLVGYVIDTQGLSLSYTYLGFAYIACMFFFIWPLIGARGSFDPIQK